MEQFLVKHSGEISHAHNFLLPATAAEFAKEVRLAVTVVAFAWVTVKAIDLAKSYTPRR